MWVLFCKLFSVIYAQISPLSQDFLALPIKIISLLIYSWPQQTYLTYGKYTSEEIIYIIEINEFYYRV